MTAFDLSELQVLPIPPAIGIGGLSDDYAATFVTPRINRDETGFLCLGCGGLLYMPGPIGFLMGASFEWDIAWGEGRCSRCGYPTRLYHKTQDGRTGTLPLQYHPDSLERSAS